MAQEHYGPPRVLIDAYFERIATRDNGTADYRVTAYYRPSETVDRDTYQNVPQCAPMGHLRRAIAHDWRVAPGLIELHAE